MREELSQLLILQKRDSEILELEKDLTRIPLDKERAHDRLANDKKAVADAKHAYQENEIAIKNTELDAGTRRQTIDRLKNQQFETRKNEEFRAIATEITRYEQLVDQFETRELELMEKADLLTNAIKDADTSLAETQMIVDENITKLDERAAQCRARLDEVLAERKKLTPLIEENLLDTYDRLFKIKKSLAVCAATNERQCEGCHVKLTPATYLKVQADKEIIQCDNCGRILYSAG